MALKPVTTPDAEAPSIELSIDGQPVQSKAGVSLYDVISQTGKIIPAMCYHYTFDPFGSCGMCLVMVINMNRCILCGECINICKDVQMVDALQFFKKEGTTHVVAKGDVGLYCEFDGDCLAVCPVGAITNKYSKYVYKPWQLKKTT